MFTDEPDDELGCLVTEGVVPPEVAGRHCKWCGEGVTLREARLPEQAGPYVVEYQHLDGYVHCVSGWQGSRVVSIADSTAQPCWKDGCLSSAEDEARRASEREG